GGRWIEGGLAGPRPAQYLVAPAGIESREDHVVDIKWANTMETFWCSIIAVAATGLMATTATAQVQSWDKQFPNQNRSRLLGQFGNAGSSIMRLVWSGRNHRARICSRGLHVIPIPRTSCAMSKRWATAWVGVCRRFRAGQSPRHDPIPTSVDSRSSIRIDRGATDRTVLVGDDCRHRPRLLQFRLVHRFRHRELPGRPGLVRRR